MRKLLLLSATLVLAGTAGAADISPNVGVGLGTMLFKDHDGLVSQVCAATTNGSFGNQTFAITAGTSDAKPWGTFWASREAKDFVRDNMDVLARDMSTGRGESIDTLAELMAVPADKREGFGKALQSNFRSVFSSSAVTADEVVDHIAQVAKSV